MENFKSENTINADQQAYASNNILGQSQNAGAPLLAPQGPLQLPPQMFTTAAQLLDLTDSEMSPSYCAHGASRGRKRWFADGEHSLRKADAGSPRWSKVGRYIAKLGPIRFVHPLRPKIYFTVPSLSNCP